MPPSRAVSSDLSITDDLLRNAGRAPARRSRNGSERDRSAQRIAPAEFHPQSAKRVAKSRVEVVRAGGWDAWPWLLHGFSTRTGGVTTAYRPAQRSGELEPGIHRVRHARKCAGEPAAFSGGPGAPASMKLGHAEADSFLQRAARRPSRRGGFGTLQGRRPDDQRTRRSARDSDGGLHSRADRRREEESCRGVSLPDGAAP